MSKKILIIEDEETISHMFASMLKEAGFKIETAENGKVGLEKIREFKPDLIMLDILMPEMNGYEVLKQLKSKDEQGHIPVLVLTSLSQEEQEKKARLLGAAGFLQKDNVHLKDILDKVNSFLD